MMLEMVHDRVATGMTREVLNGCCTAMWKANAKTTTLLLFLDGLFQKIWNRLYGPVARQTT
jgi:hypothetical protein